MEQSRSSAIPYTSVYKLLKREPTAPPWLRSPALLYLFCNHFSILDNFLVEYEYTTDQKKNHTSYIYLYNFIFGSRGVMILFRALKVLHFYFWLKKCGNFIFGSKSVAILFLAQKVWQFYFWLKKCGNFIFGSKSVAILSFILVLY